MTNKITLTGTPNKAGTSPNIMVPLKESFVQDSFTGTGKGTVIFVRGKKSAEVRGFGSASMTLERSIDGQANFVGVMLPDGTPATYTAAGSTQIDESKTAGAWYRWSCDIYGSGTIVGTIGDNIGAQ